MRHFDVLVAPSRQEPFGTVLAEAMAAGTPVVATRVGGLAVVVAHGETGLLVTPGRPDELAAAVLEVLSRRAEMGAAARVSAQRFGADAYADRVEAILLKAAGLPPARRKGDPSGPHASGGAAVRPKAAEGDRSGPEAGAS
jgi:glycosyltransferase involved in cell wall biosynthesis